MAMTTLRLADAASDPHTRRALNALSMTVAKSKKIVVITGAGISCSCGIPDFRSQDGLYALVKSRYPTTFLKGRDLFSSTLFRDPASTALFYTFISQLKQSIDKATPGPTHDFLRTLDLKGKLLRSYTQNVDGMEERVGLVGTSAASGSGSGSSSSGSGSSSGSVSPNSEGGRTGRAGRKGKMSAKELKAIKNVQLHGTIHRVRCTFCSADVEFLPEYAESFDEGVPPDCPECSARSSARLLLSRRPLKIGTLRPSMVLYDEPHPQSDLIALFQESDMRRRPDLVLVMGTSLRVHGLKGLVKEFARVVHGDANTDADADAEKDLKEAEGDEDEEKKTKSKSTGTRLTKSEKLAGGEQSKPKPPRVVFINKTPPAPLTEWASVIDCWVEGETDAWVRGVEGAWRAGRPQDWEVQGALDGERGVLRVGKNANGGGKGKRVAGAKKGKDILPKDADVDGIENVPPPMPIPQPGMDSDAHTVIDLTKSPVKKQAGRPRGTQSKPKARSARGAVKDTVEVEVDVISLPSTQEDVEVDIISLPSTQESSTQDVAEVDVDVISLPSTQEPSTRESSSFDPNDDVDPNDEVDFGFGFGVPPPSSPMSMPPSSPSSPMSVVTSPISPAQRQEDMSIVTSPIPLGQRQVDMDMSMMSVVMSSVPRLSQLSPSRMASVSVSPSRMAATVSPLSSPGSSGSSGEMVGMVGTPSKRRKERAYYQAQGQAQTQSTQNQTRAQHEAGGERDGDEGGESGVESSPSKRRARRGANVHVANAGAEEDVEVEVERRLLFGPSRVANLNLVSRGVKITVTDVQQVKGRKTRTTRGEMDMSVDVDLKDVTPLDASNAMEKENMEVGQGRKTRSGASMKGGAIPPRVAHIPQTIKAAVAKEDIQFVDEKTHTMTRTRTSTRARMTTLTGAGPGPGRGGVMRRGKGVA